MINETGIQTCVGCGSPLRCSNCEAETAPYLASLTVQHERWVADRWKVMLRVNHTRFQIGSECDTREAADRLRDDFASALNALDVEIPSTEVEPQCDDCKRECVFAGTRNDTPCPRFSAKRKG